MQNCNWILKKSKDCRLTSPWQPADLGANDKINDMPYRLTAAVYLIKEDLVHP